MSFLLDTNVLSEPMKERPNRAYSPGSHKQTKTKFLSV